MYVIGKPIPHLKRELGAPASFPAIPREYISKGEILNNLKKL